MKRAFNSGCMGIEERSTAAGMPSSLKKLLPGSFCAAPPVACHLGHAMRGLPLFIYTEASQSKSEKGGRI